MCGRFSLDARIAKIQAMLEEIENTQNNPPVKTGEIFPTDIVPVLRERDGRLQARAMSWGFPRWDGKGVVFNARAETALDKPLFRNALRKNPVVVPTTGFYEWRAEAGRRKKDKYLFRKPGSDLVYLAGFAKPVGSDVFGTPEVTECFTILTTEANPSLRDYHDRMPIVLEADEREAWLNGGELPFFLHREPPALTAAKV